MSSEPPIIVTDEMLDAQDPQIVSGLKYILTEPNTKYSFIVRALDDNNEIVTEHHVKAGEDLDEAELNLLVGTILNEFKINNIKPSTDFAELRAATAAVIKDITDNPQQ